ncbi:MAG: hypothetical protein Q9224_006093 [Gallowayella concinna]
MVALGDLRITIMVDEQSMADFPDDETENQNASFVSRFVECISGATFSVHCEIKRTMGFKSESIVLYVFTDGRCATSVVLQAAQIRASHCVYTDTLAGQTRKVNDHWVFRPFVFSEIKHVEEATRQTINKHKRDRLGTIEVQAHHVKAKPHVTAANQWDEANMPNQLLTLSEKELKGSNLTHSAKYVGGSFKQVAFLAYTYPSYGAKKIVAALRTVELDYIDGFNSPFAIIRFKYRSKKALQSMLLIPRTPSPVPLEQRPVESMSVEEMQRLLRHYRESYTVEPQARNKLESTLAEQHIKHERDVKPEHCVKRERDKPEHCVKRERDEEVDEILASAYVKKAKTAETIDLLDK